MAIPVWPATLPQQPLSDGFSEDHGAIVRRTPMDKGPAKMAYLGLRPDTFSVNFDLDAAQVEILRAFVRDTLGYVKRFSFTHPRTLATVELRIVPQQDGQFYRVGHRSWVSWPVAVVFEVLP